jgi:hypothetical protein
MDIYSCPSYQVRLYSHAEHDDALTTCTVSVVAAVQAPDEPASYGLYVVQSARPSEIMHETCGWLCAASIISGFGLVYHPNYVSRDELDDGDTWSDLDIDLTAATVGLSAVAKLHHILGWPMSGG